jgi:hypothetical protein
MSKHKAELLVFLGAALLVIGAFTPLAKLAGVSVSYPDLQKDSVYLLVLFALAGPLLILLKQRRLVLISAVGVWLTLLYPALQALLKPEKQSALGELVGKAAAPLKRAVGNVLLDVVNLQWGGYLFLLGLLALSVGAVMVTLGSRK